MVLDSQMVNPLLFALRSSHDFLLVRYDPEYTLLATILSQNFQIHNIQLSRWIQEEFLLRAVTTYQIL